MDVATEPYKVALSALAMGLTFYAFLPYIRGIIKGRVKPHVFSWITWGITTFVVFLAQLQDNGGPGAWAIGVSGVITMIIALLAYLKRDAIRITKLDWCFFAGALSSLLFWYLADDPMWAVVVLTTVDLLGFGPTIRKVYHYPESESQMFFALFTTRNLIVIAALEHYSVTTVLFPAAISIACLLLMGMMWGRRQRV